MTEQDLQDLIKEAKEAGASDAKKSTSPASNSPPGRE